MKTLNLHRVWEIMNKLIEKQDILSESSIHINFFGNRSNYYGVEDFKEFLNHYNFSVNEYNIIVFNDDRIPYEDWTNQDFNHIPRKILDLTDEELGIWAEEEVKRQKEQERLNKIAEKEKIKQQIERLQKQLENE